MPECNKENSYTKSFSYNKRMFKRVVLRNKSGTDFSQLHSYVSQESCKIEGSYDISDDIYSLKDVKR